MLLTTQIKMKISNVIINLLVFLSGVNGLYLRQHESSEQDPKCNRLLRLWNNYKKKFKTPILQHFEKVAENQQQMLFNELEVLYLIPLITEHTKKGLITESDKEILSEIYGNLWTMIEEEAQREVHIEMNPLFKALINAIQLLNFKGAESTNDIQHNTLRQVTNPPGRKLYIKKSQEDHPSQKLLNMAAILIRSMEPNKKDDAGSQSNRIRNSKFYRAVSPDRASLNLDLSSNPIRKITRSRRNLDKSSHSNDLSADRIDELLKMFLHEKGLKYSNDEDFEETKDDDYYDMDNSQVDYAYGDHYEYDEKIRPRKSFRNDYENGSFQDLIFLAAKHRFKDGKRLKNRHTSIY